ncbi:unnamed protein product [Pedinophyceae sp. YPF-701]|nr:unnamed protein product [Pedinophyceae sp. YPF-701]
MAPEDEVSKLRNRLRDTQDSLAIALARIEGYRLREKHLLQHNNDLRRALVAVGVDESHIPGGVPTTGPEHLYANRSRRSGEHNGAIAQQDSLASALEGMVSSVSSPKARPQGGELQQLQEDEHPVRLYSPSGRSSQASVILSDTCMQIVEVKARIFAKDFVGITHGRRPAPTAASATPRPPLAPASQGAAHAKPPQRLGGVPATSPIKQSRSFLNRLGLTGARGASATEAPKPAARSPQRSPSQAGVAGVSHDTLPSQVARPGGAALDVGERCASQPDSDPGLPGRETSASDPGREVFSFEAGGESGGDDDASRPVWEVYWKEGGGEGELRKVVFEAPTRTRAVMDGQVQAWSVALGRRIARAPEQTLPAAARNILESDSARDASTPPVVAVDSASGRASDIVPSAQAGAADVIRKAAGRRRSPSQPEVLSSAEALLPGEMPDKDARAIWYIQPEHLAPGPFLPEVVGSSRILGEAQIRSLTAALPLRVRQRRWVLQYTSARHGTSLATLYRQCSAAHSVLVVRDSGGYVFGTYATEPWKVSPRYYGTGECFVFQLAPHAVAFRWRQGDPTRNSFFQFSSPESLAVGGGSHFALWLDSDLQHGHSGVCQTFGSTCLSSAEDFKAVQVEVWGIVSVVD